MKLDETNSRIFQAIKNRNLEELRWAEAHLEMCIDTAYEHHPKKAAKNVIRLYKTKLGLVQSEIASADTTLYDRWIISLFDRDETKGDWRFESEDEPIEIPDSLVPILIKKLNNNLSEILKTYSDWQIGMGLNYIYNGSCSNYAHTLRNQSISLEIRLAAIFSIKKLYSDCLELRCSPVLGHLSESGSELNNFCYMLWDATSIIPYQADHQNRAEILNTVAEVLKFALTLNNPACIESALHGLGHMVYKYPKAAEIIQGYISNARKIDPRLLTYAEAAKTGRIN